MARNFKVGDIVTHQIIGNTNPMQRNKSYAIITKIENGYIFYQYTTGAESSESLSFAKNGALSKSRNQEKLKNKFYKKENN
jgi:hypothetical protein|tara:strand:- start:8375 stop:8617 length:243 start_codon:yes stop_codon:yes gene_type:complete